MTEINFTSDMVLTNMCDRMLATVRKNRNFVFSDTYNSIQSTLSKDTDEQKKYLAAVFHQQDLVKRFMIEEEYIYMVADGLFRLTRHGIKAQKIGGHDKYQDWLDPK
jgi:ABC-type oligopeptide transport system ATPase subunit